MALGKFAKGVLEECAVNHHILVRSLCNLLSYLLYYTKSITNSHVVVTADIRDIAKSIASNPIGAMHTYISRYTICKTFQRAENSIIAILKTKLTSCRLNKSWCGGAKCVGVG